MDIAYSIFHFKYFVLEWITTVAHSYQQEEGNGDIISITGIGLTVSVRFPA